MTTLLAIDPAADLSVSDTGFALCYYDEDTPLTVKESGIIEGGFRGFTDVVNGKWGDILETVDEVVCENFISYNPYADHTPLKIIGVIQFLRPDAILQPASGKNTVVPNTALKDLGHWKTKGEGAGHHRDEVEAIRHAYLHLAKQKHIPTLKKLTGKK